MGYSGTEFTDLAVSFGEFLFEASSILRTDYNLGKFLFVLFHQYQLLIFNSNINVEMSFNFVDSFAWNASLFTSGVIAFPYWEIWTLPETEDLFFSTMSGIHPVTISVTKITKLEIL